MQSTRPPKTNRNNRPEFTPDLARLANRVSTTQRRINTLRRKLAGADIARQVMADELKALERAGRIARRELDVARVHGAPPNDRPDWDAEDGEPARDASSDWD